MCGLALKTKQSDTTTPEKSAVFLSCPCFVAKKKKRKRKNKNRFSSQNTHKYIFFVCFVFVLSQSRNEPFSGFIVPDLTLILYIDFFGVMSSGWIYQYKNKKSCLKEKICLSWNLFRN